MNFGARVFGIATAAGLVFALALPAAAQTTTTPTSGSSTDQTTNGTNPPPATTTVPNSGTSIKCNPNGTATVTQNPNAEQSSSQSVAGTPVTQTNPNGPGTTTTQTPAMQKPTSVANAQCPRTSPTTPTTTTTTPMNSTTTMPAGSGPGGQQMNALNDNPNGANWIDKFNRPVSTSTDGTYAGTKSKHGKKHHTKRASGGGGH